MGSRWGRVSIGRELGIRWGSVELCCETRRIKSISSLDVFRNDNRSSTSPTSVESLEILAWVSPRFVGSLSGLVTNLVQVSPETVLDKVKGEDVLGIFVR